MPLAADVAGECLQEIGVCPHFCASRNAPARWAGAPGRGLPATVHLFEVRDPDFSVRKAGEDLELAAHGPDVGAQSADVHVGAALELGDARLAHLERRGERWKDVSDFDSAGRD